MCCVTAYISPAAQRGGHLRILAIEDDADTREMYGRMLRDEGHTPILAADGIEGLQLIDPKPDLIILDLSLPGMDGYEILKTLKADPTTAAIPVLVVSVNRFDRPDDLSGFVAALQKPFDLPLLPAMLTLVAR